MSFGRRLALLYPMLFSFMIAEALIAEYMHLLMVNSAKLRARQKEQLAKRDAVNESHPVEGLAGIESLMHSPAIPKGGNLGAGLVHSVQEGTSVNTEDNRYAQLSETPNSNADSLSRIDKLSKHKMSNHFDVSVKNPGRSLADLLPPNHHNKGGINIVGENGAMERAVAALR